MTQAIKIIAEAEINHNGDVEMAKQLVDAADKCGADYVKFQCFTADAFIAPGSGFLPIFKERELSLEEFGEVRDHAAEKRITMISTASDLTGLAMIAALDFPFIKVGSTNIDNIPLLDGVAETGKPVILSTGASTLGEIERALTILSRRTDDLTLLHCTVQYPADPALLNLRAIPTLRQAFPGVTVGYSDHSVGITAGIAAAALGATVLEKHFTLDNDLSGPDHHFSANPELMTAYVTAVRETEAMLGDARKQPVGPEHDIRIAGRRYLTAMTTISACAEINSDNVRPRRVDITRFSPEALLTSEMVETVKGWHAVHEIADGAAITLANIRPPDRTIE